MKKTFESYTKKKKKKPIAKVKKPIAKIEKKVCIEPVKVHTVRVMNENDQIVEVQDVGVMGLFQPQQCDIDEILENNEAYREHQRDSLEDFN